MMKRSIFVVAILIVAGVIISPYFCGLLMQKKYQEIISLYASQGYIQARIVDYQRGWFSSDATLSLKINDPTLQLENSKASSDLIIEQHIQHGPIFLPYLADAPSLFGVAFIENHIHFSPAFAALVLPLGITESTVRIDNNFISFFGHFYEYFRLGNWQFSDPSSHGEIQLTGLEGIFWISPQEMKFNGDVSVKELFISSEGDSITVKNATLQLDQMKESHGLWMGSHNLNFPEVIYHDIEEGDVKIYGANFSGSLHSFADFLNGDKKISIDKIEMGDQTIGPAQLQINVEKINIPAIVTMINTYHDIMTTGELYQSRLQNRMLELLPKIITPGANITLSKLKIVTPQGDLKANGDILWPETKYFSPDSLRDLIASSNKNFSLHVSIKLTNEIIKLASGIPYVIQNFSQINRQELSDARGQIKLVIKENAAFLETLVKNRVLPEDMAMEVIVMQKDLTPWDEYSARVRYWLLTKQITLPMTYLLYWQYASAERPYLFLEHKVDEYQEVAAQQMHSQLNDLIKNGYVVEDNGNYTVGLQWLNGTFSANGHAKN